MEYPGVYTSAGFIDSLTPFYIVIIIIIYLSLLFNKAYPPPPLVVCTQNLLYFES